MLHLVMGKSFKHGEFRRNKAIKPQTRTAELIDPANEQPKRCSMSFEREKGEASAAEGAREERPVEFGGCNLAKHRDGKIVSTIRRNRRTTDREESGDGKRTARSERERDEGRGRERERAQPARRRNNRCETWEFRRVLITRRRTRRAPNSYK